jgi:hypothetical protein
MKDALTTSGDLIGGSYDSGNLGSVAKPNYMPLNQLYPRSSQ